MVSMVVNRPMREDHVRSLCFYDLSELVIVRRVNSRMTIYLSGIRRARFEDFTSFGGFTDANALRTGFLWRVTFIQVKQHYLVAEVRVAGDSAATPVFRVARMSTRHYDFE